MSRPTLTLIAGANGSGKTTLTRWNSELFRGIPIFDPDTISKNLQSTTRGTFPIAGARQVLTSAIEHLKAGKSFAVETTLAGENYLFMMLKAGCPILCAFCKGWASTTKLERLKGAPR